MSAKQACAIFYWFLALAGAFALGGGKWLAVGAFFVGTVWYLVFMGVHLVRTRQQLPHHLTAAVAKVDEAVLLGPVSAWVAEGEAQAVRDWEAKHPTHWPPGYRQSSSPPAQGALHEGGCSRGFCWCARECDCPSGSPRTGYARQNGPLRCGTCHGFVPHDRYVLPKALRNCKHEDTVDISTLDNSTQQSLCIRCGKHIEERDPDLPWPMRPAERR